MMQRQITISNTGHNVQHDVGCTMQRNPWRSAGVLRALFAIFAIACHGACGGGNGAGGRPGGAGFDVALDSEAVQLVALQNASPPPPRAIGLQIAGASQVLITTSFEGTAPSWLAASIGGSPTHYSVVLAVVSTALAHGDHPATLVISVRDPATGGMVTRKLGVVLTIGRDLAIADEPHAAAFTYGSSDMAESLAVEIGAGAGHWRAESSAPWLRIGSTTPLDGETSLLAVTVDAAALAPGSYTASLAITGDDTAQGTATKPFALTVRPPVLGLSGDPIVLGGVDGSAELVAQLSISLDTGSAAYRVTVEPTAESGGAWLVANPADARIDARGATIAVTGLAVALTPGTYRGALRVRATVRDLVIDRTIAVTANLEDHRLLVGTTGVGLVANPPPARSVTTRALSVATSLGRPGVAWRATADQPWLHVTAGGTVGEPLVLTADPAGVAADVVQLATVTVTSLDPAVRDAEAIRVGFRVNSTAPADVNLPIVARNVATSPVEPIAFFTNRTQAIVGYDTDTGALVRNFPTAVPSAGAIAVGPDGRRLYVYDANNLRVVELDATTGTVLAGYTSRRDRFPVPSGGGLAIVRAGGHSFLITPVGRSYDVATGTEYTDDNFLAPLAAISIVPAITGGSVLVEADTTYTPFNTRGVYRLRWSALGGGRLVTEHRFSTGFEQTGHQGCISADNQTAYTVTDGIRGLSMASGETVQMLPMASGQPRAMLCLWNGVIAGGIDSFGAPPDVFLYDGPSGIPLARVSSGDAKLVELGLAASSDSTRLISLTGDCCDPSSDRVRFQTLPAPRPPRGELE